VTPVVALRPRGRRLSLIAIPFLAVTAVAGGLLAARQLSGSRPDARAAAAHPRTGPGGATGAELKEEASTIRGIASQVAALRGLDWKRPPGIKIVPEAELASRYAAASARQSDPARSSHQEAMFKFLHLIPPDLGYAKTVESVMESGIRGFYDSQTKEVFVGATATGQLPPNARMALAHELDHALTDQHFDFGTRQDALDRADAEDQSLALSSLVEGDAVLLQNRWMAKYLSGDEQVLALFGGASSSSSLGPVPSFLQDESLFPYTAGLKFVQYLYAAEGLSGVDRAYKNPPTSSDQIMHPDVFLKGQRWDTSRSLPPPGAWGCEPIRSGTLGPFVMSELLRQQAPQAAADGVVEGWNGDAYAVVRCPGGVGMVERWQAHDQATASRLAATLSRWAKGWSGSAAGPGPDGRFLGPSGAGVVRVRGAEVLLTLAERASALDQVASIQG